MPRRAARVCAEPGCPQLQPCTVHATSAKRADLNRPNSNARGYDRRWRRKSEQYRAAHPICEEPGCGAPSKHVDHIDGLGPSGPRGFDDDNLKALCHPHHSSKTATYDRGFGNTPKPRQP